MLRWFRTNRNFHLGSKSLAALLPVEPWSSAVGARGELQQAWFRVSGIPIDQRNVRTIARVGGLVGKTVAIVEKTIFKQEYVRVKIACRNVELVPDSTEVTLGMFI